MRALGSPVNADVDIYNTGNGNNVYNATPDASNPRWLQFDVSIGDGTKNLDGTGGDFDLKVTIGSQVYDGAAQTKTIDASQTRVRFQTSTLLVPANTAVQIHVTSPNSADTDVDCTVQPYDVAPLQPATAARTLTVESDGMAHADVKEVAGQTVSATAGVDFDDIATIETVTTAIGSTGSGLSAIPWNAAWDAEVQSECADALTAFAWSGITISAVSGAVGSVTGNVGGNVSGSVGSISGVTFPTNFAALGINVSGHVSRVTLVDTTTANTDMRGTDNALLASSAPTNFGDLAISATTGYVTIGSVGATSVIGPDDFKATGFSTHSAADVVTALGTGSTLTDCLTATGYSTHSAEDVRTEMDSNSTQLAKLGSPAGASISADIAAVKTDTGNIASRITATLFDGITSLASWLGALAGKTADTATRAEINATTAGAGYNETTMSLEANKDEHDATQTAVDAISAGNAPTLLQTTTIATVASQTQITLTAGSADNDAYNSGIAIFVDQSDTTQKSFVAISDYIGSSRTLTLESAPKFTIAAGDTVYLIATSKTLLTDDVVQSLTGSVVRFAQPTWTGSGWDRPIVKGDSYIGGLAINITIENWAGDQAISAASSIKLSGTRTVSGTTTSFEWTATPANVSVSGSTTTIPFELTASDTDVTAGEYTADVRASWTTNSEYHSLIRPTFKIEIVDPVSTFA